MMMVMMMIIVGCRDSYLLLYNKQVMVDVVVEQSEYLLSIYNQLDFVIGNFLVNIYNFMIVSVKFYFSCCIKRKIKLEVGKLIQRRLQSLSVRLWWLELDLVE